LTAQKVIEENVQIFHVTSGSTISLSRYENTFCAKTNNKTNFIWLFLFFFVGLRWDFKRFPRRMHENCNLTLLLLSQKVFSSL